MHVNYSITQDKFLELEKKILARVLFFSKSEEHE